MEPRFDQLFRGFSLAVHSNLKSVKTTVVISIQRQLTLQRAVYIDDLSELEAINLKKQLVIDPVVRPQPLCYHERTSHILGPSQLLQSNLIGI